MNLILRLSILILIIIVVEFYFTRKVLSIVSNLFPVDKPYKVRRIIIALILFFNLFLIVGVMVLVYFAVFGNAPNFPPDNFLFDVFLQFPFWLFVLYVIQCTLLFIMIDLLRLVLYPFYKSRKDKVKKIVFDLQFLILLFFLLYVPARAYHDFNTVSVRVVEYEKKNLPKVLEGFKLVLIADVQADKYTNKKRLGNFIDKVNQTKPDLVLIAGDVITSTPDYIGLSAEYIGQIKSKYGVYACVGDHDNWAYRRDTERSLREVIAALAAKNILMIDNKIKTIKVDSTKIGISFITNNYVHSINKNLLDSLSSISDSLNLKIFLTHQPRPYLVDKAREKNYDLFLAGHTHGGQLTFWFPFFNLSPTLVETKYVRGDFHFGNMLAVVNRGLGMSLVPLRYNSTPEITVIVLASK